MAHMIGVNSTHFLYPFLSVLLLRFTCNGQVWLLPERVLVHIGSQGAGQVVVGVVWQPRLGKQTLEAVSDGGDLRQECSVTHCFVVREGVNAACCCLCQVHHHAPGRFLHR